MMEYCANAQPSSLQKLSQGAGLEFWQHSSTTPWTGPFLFREEPKTQLLVGVGMAAKSVGACMYKCVREHSHRVLRLLIGME